MQTSPIKKILIAFAALSVAITIMTANSLESVVLLKASRNISNFVAGNASGGAASSEEGEAEKVERDENKGKIEMSDEEKEQALQDMLDKGEAELDEDGNIVVKMPETTEEIIEYYKKALNNAKDNGKDVIRVKDGAINYKGVVKAGNLSSIAESLMGMFMVSDANSIEETNVEWKAADLPPAGAKSNLTPAGVKSATIEEDGDYFIVTIVANNAKNPKAGDDGVGSISSVIEESQITGAIGSVPGLELNNISIDYEDVTAIATIDKVTGYMVALTTSSPCYLSLDAKVPLLGSIDDACVGIQVISAFTVSY
jgi:hypothetical protein